MSMVNKNIKEILYINNLHILGAVASNESVKAILDKNPDYQINMCVKKEFAYYDAELCIGTLNPAIHVSSSDIKTFTEIAQDFISCVEKAKNMQSFMTSSANRTTNIMIDALNDVRSMFSDVNSYEIRYYLHRDWGNWYGLIVATHDNQSYTVGQDIWIQGSYNPVFSTFTKLVR